MTTDPLEQQDTKGVALRALEIATHANSRIDSVSERFRELKHEIAQDRAAHATAIATLRADLRDDVQSLWNFIKKTMAAVIGLLLTILGMLIKPQLFGG